MHCFKYVFAYAPLLYEITEFHSTASAHFVASPPTYQSIALTPRVFQTGEMVGFLVFL
jgi:hypothetical protein